MNDMISRQAAIDTLERKKDKNAKGDIGGFYNKIIQNDIDALMQLPSAQPECEDAVSREAVVKMLHDYFDSMLETDSVCPDDLYHEAFNLPSVTPKQPGWIPCSERLPEEADYKGCSECIDGAVWYYTDKGAMGLGYYYESTKVWSTTYDESPYGEVIAWMPPPIAP